MSSAWIVDSSDLIARRAEQTDAQLVTELATCGITLDDDLMERLTRNFPSVQTMTVWLLKEHQLEVSDEQQRHVWSCLASLWERRYPDRENFERLNERIRAGQTSIQAAARHWPDAWRILLDLLERFRFDSLNDFDDCFDGTLPVLKWLTLFLRSLNETAHGNSEIQKLRESVIPEASRWCRLSDGPDVALLAAELKLAQGD